MKIYLLRHGEAESRQVDPARPLTGRGKLELRSHLSKIFAKYDLNIKKIYHSPKMRAVQTAQIAAEILTNHKIACEETAGLLPEDNPIEWFDRIMKADEDTLLVTHLPYVAALANKICGEYIDFYTGTMACIEIKENSISLEWVESVN